MSCQLSYRIIYLVMSGWVYCGPLVGVVDLHVAVLSSNHAMAPSIGIVSSGPKCSFLSSSHPFIHLFAHPLSFSHSLIHSSTSPPVHSSTCPLVHLSTLPLFHFPTLSLFHSSSFLLIHWCTCPLFLFFWNSTHIHLQRRKAPQRVWHEVFPENWHL